VFGSKTAKGFRKIRFKNLNLLQTFKTATNKSLFTVNYLAKTFFMKILTAYDIIVINE